MRHTKIFTRAQANLPEPGLCRPGCSYATAINSFDCSLATKSFNMNNMKWKGQWGEAVGC